MVDVETVRRRLQRLDELLQRMQAIAARPVEQFLSDDVAQAAAAYLLQTAIQIVLDIGAHVLSDRGVLDWDEYRQLPRRLAQEGIIPLDLAERLERAAGQRNILVHLYLEVDPEVIHRTLENDLDVFPAFAAAIVPLLQGGEEPAEP